MSTILKTSLLGLALLALGCDAPDFHTNPDGGAAFYNGAGSVWNAQLNPDHTFTLLHFPAIGDMTADQLINGNAAPASGLTSMTVTSSAGTGQPPEGAVGYAALIPGSLLVLNPFGGGALTPMVPTGGCPSSTVSLNLVKVKVAGGWTATTSDATATFSYDPKSGSALLPTRYSLHNVASANAPLSLGGGSCGDGIVTSDSGAELFMTAAGAAIVHTQASTEAQGEDEVYLGLPQATDALTPPILAGSYAGFLYVSDAAQTNTPIQVTLTARSTDLSGTIDNSGIGPKLVLNGTGGYNGLLSGTIYTSCPDGGGTAQPLACAAQIAAGDSMKNLIACAGASQSGGFASVILVGD